MRSRTRSHALVTLAATAALLVPARDAAAHGDVDVDRPSDDSRVEVRSSARPAERPEGPEGEHEDRFQVGLDMVLGWGRVPFAVQNLPTTGEQALTYTRQDQTAADVQSFILLASAEVTEHLEVGFRLPFTFATFSPDGSASRTATSLGNLELEGAYAVPLGRPLKLVAALGVALPTAAGQEIPDGLTAQPLSTSTAGSYDRWSLSRAAAFARGYEDNALFEPNRLGLVPKVSLLYTFRGLTIEPSVKLENLIGTSTLLQASYVGELVGGLRVGYWLEKHVEVALRGWVNAGYSGTADDKVTAGALEPQVVTRLGPVKPYAGVILPVAGPPKDGGAFGVRLGILGSF